MRLADTWYPISKFISVGFSQSVQCCHVFFSRQKTAETRVPDIRRREIYTADMSVLNRSLHSLKLS